MYHSQLNSIKHNSAHSLLHAHVYYAYIYINVRLCDIYHTLPYHFVVHAHPAIDNSSLIKMVVFLFVMLLSIIYHMLKSKPLGYGKGEEKRGKERERGEREEVRFSKFSLLHSSSKQQLIILHICSLCTHKSRTIAKIKAPDSYISNHILYILNQNY